jgi:AcrR family transcriptional regulator
MPPSPSPYLHATPAPPDPAGALLDAAREIFVGEGLKGLSVRRVAEQAGCTTMAVYTRYGGKDGLVAALFDEGFERLAQAQQAVGAPLSAGKRVLALCQAYRATAMAFPHHYALMLGQFSGEHVPSPQSSAKAMATLQTLVDAVAAGLVPSRDRDRQATEVAHRLFAFCHGWVSLERLGFFGEAGNASGAFERAAQALLAR